jgi:hypothetical protein
MIGKTSPDVKGNPRSATFQIGDPDDKLALAYAMAQGYRITLDGDGCAEIVKADGTTYVVHEWQCDCPDAQGRNGGSYVRGDGARFCKHVLYLMQVHPCRYCGSTMPLTEHRTAFGDVFQTFDCPTCKASVDARLVKRRRQIARAVARAREDEARVRQEAALATH